MINELDRETIKGIVKEILLEDTNLFKELVREILVENQVIITEGQATRRERIEQLVEQDFDKYDSVFKDLA